MPSFESLCGACEDTFWLGSKTLPPVEPSVLFDAVRAACVGDAEHPLRQAAAQPDVAKAVQDLRPAERFAGLLDGRAVCCLVLAFRLFGSPSALAARATASKEPPQTVDCAGACTDAMPVAGSPDSVQLALLSFLKGGDARTCEADLALAAYGRAQAYGTLPALLHSCTVFLTEVGELIDADEEQAPPAVSPKIPAILPQAPQEPPVTAAATAAPPEESDATKAFYRAAESPFSLTVNDSAPSHGEQQKLAVSPQTDDEPLKPPRIALRPPLPTLDDEPPTPRRLAPAETVSLLSRSYASRTARLEELAKALKL